MKGMKLPAQRDSALLTGEAGILLVACRLAPSRELADDLLARVRENFDNEAEEVMWGSPGTLFAAQAMLEWTGDERWRDAWNESADALLSRRDSEGYWMQRLYGEELRSLTPPHGLVGNVQALLPLLDANRAAALKRETAALLAGTVVQEGGLANWPPRPRPELPGPDGQIRVQWDAGAPGIVWGRRNLDDELLRGGAELPWRTGPGFWRKGRVSVTALPATVTHSSRSSQKRATSAGSSVPAVSPCTRSRKSNGCAASTAAAATRCGPGTSAQHSTRPTASTGRAAIPSSTVLALALFAHVR